MKKAKALVVTAAALLLTACSSSGGFQDTGDAGSASDAKLRLLVNVTPVLTKQFYEDLVKPYTDAHPGVTVSIEAPTAADVSATLQQQLAAGSPPDLVSGSLGRDTVPQLTALPEQQWVKDAPYAEQSRVGGAMWQAGSGNQVQSLVFYNKAAFAKAGITTVPKSLADLTAALVKLKGAGYVPTQTSGEWVTGAQVQMLGNVNVLNTAPDWFAQRNENKTSFAGSPWRQVLETYQGWVKQGLTPKDAMGLKYQDAIDQFLAGKSATFVMGGWFVPTADEAKKSFDVGVFAVPTLDGSPAPVAGNPSIPWSVTKSSKNQAAALDLLKFLVTDKDAVTKELKAEGNFRKGFDYEASALNKEVAAIVSGAPSTVVASNGQGDNSAPTGYNDEFNKLVQGLYLDQKPGTVLKSIDSWYTSNAK
ncbi:ABC transporter substrate-binding protein [Paractinoplanes atraurantiacus]|uniref:Multiple sugar transport system substrate-binding protein/raffinose/stachyose/melibiose transport system substrate-binding protein n=1 Tax=Paractinoplanes atraurantiacus TaxID=1036182 RepID=A0A285JRN7_9ACTN|nr:ABC transporter substrate-binding protein [Actinoplanes atraurantiacus]SNY62974.1 multiple sugar transport system substrate-binding protein/raffinose/stachyose/melibiose transport system substrate-binding protein [Actinoplanes atraurantiacus]